MPSLTIIKPIGHLKFLSHGLKLPTSAHWKQPKGIAAKQYEMAILPNQKFAVPKLIPPFFQPQNPNKFHVETCDRIGKQFKALHDDALDAVKFGHDMYRLQAGFQNLKIMAVSAIGTPGCLKGPPLANLIKMAPSFITYVKPNAMAYKNAVADGVGECFKQWQDGVSVPGLPWYPAFAAFPGPMAPPMPNVPMPLITCPSAGMASIVNPMMLAKAMENKFSGGLKGKDKDSQYKALFDSIATVLAMAFMAWLPMQMVNLVMGMGPIPTFAPPYVPVGPVMNGNNLPGVHLLA
jgi:hypothetical protein